MLTTLLFKMFLLLLVEPTIEWIAFYFLDTETEGPVGKGMTVCIQGHTVKLHVQLSGVPPPLYPAPVPTPASIGLVPVPGP